MADISRICDLKQHFDEEVVIRGWLYNRRSSGKLHFLQVRDGSGIVQAVVFKGDVAPELFEKCRNLPYESSIKVTGNVRQDDRSPGGCEVAVANLEVLQEAEEYPIALQKDQGVDHLFRHRHLWLRSKKPHAVMRVRATIVKAVRDFFDQNDFTLIDAPIFTPSACEGTSTLFECNYFDEKAYLTQSGQLYMEAAAMAHGQVYCFGPTFRAEKSKTRRHLTEFWMVEP